MNYEDEQNGTTLSQFLHAIFERIIDHRAPIDKKIEFLKSLNDFFQYGTTASSHDLEKIYRNPTDMFSPLVSDMYITIQPPLASATVRTTERINPNNFNSVEIMSGIKLPNIEWQANFRKGYSVLFWVRFHTPSKPYAKSNESYDDITSHLTEEPQILYRFATSLSKDKSYGIQATICRNSDINGSVGENPSMKESQLPCLLQFESLYPPSVLKHLEKTQVIHSNTLTISAMIPNGKWTLIGVQHSFPYLNKPSLSVNIDGVEIGKGELSYPNIVADVGGDGIMRHNYILCNIPRNIERDRNYAGTENNANSLRVEKIDVAGFGLYKESIPSLIQGIICEHGPCYSADGVIPAVPPVVQNRDAVILSGDSLVTSSQKDGNKIGPFGLNLNTRVGPDSIGRPIGIPVTTGVMLSSDGNYQGQILLQKLLSKLVLGFNASKSFEAGGNRVIIRLSFGCTVGNTADIPKVGLAQPKSPVEESVFHRNDFNEHETNSSDGELDTIDYACCIGNISLFSATIEFLNQDAFAHNHLINMPVQAYHLPSCVDGIKEDRLCPIFINTYTTMNSFAYILQAFHLALPPPGYVHNLQMEQYYDSFDHLYSLVIHQNGALGAQLIQLFASNMFLGGRIRDEIVQNGYLHILATLLRKVLNRAIRLGMFDSNVVNLKEMSSKDRLWQKFRSRETPYDDLSDSHSILNSGPNHIPTLIVESCCSVIAVACGPVRDDTKKWKRHELSFHIRRASDISLSSVFGFAFDFDLFGCDPLACAAILNEVAQRFCSAGVNILKSNELTDKFDSGYGQLLRSEITVEYLLDLIRIRFGHQMISSPAHDCDIRDAYQSVSVSISRILYTMLKYSLSSNKFTFSGEVDISACVSALADCPLGTVGCHAILTSIRDILVYCELFPNNVCNVIYSQHDMVGVNDADNRLKQLKSEIAMSLARSLCKSRFHDVIAPILLSRTVFDGRTDLTMNKSQSNTIDPKSEEIMGIYHWRYHWNIVLHIFTWICSVAGSDGDKAAESTGMLILHSTKAGALQRCVFSSIQYSITSIIVPQLPTKSSAINPGSSFDSDRIEPHFTEMVNRIKVVIHLLSGLTSCVLSKGHLDKDELKKADIEDLIILIRSVRMIVSYLISVNRKVFFGLSVVEGRRSRSYVSEKSEVKLILSFISHFVITAVIFEHKITELINSVYDNEEMSEISEQHLDWEHKWHELEELLDSDWNLLNKPEKLNVPKINQINILYDLQKDVFSSAGLLILSGMVTGGGEVSTLVWRAILSALETGCSLIPNSKETEMKYILCRLVSTVLEMILHSGSTKTNNPWTSIELCAATARLSDLIEEKRLLEVIEEDSNQLNSTLSLDQTRLLLILIRLLESGRDNTGWCQLLLPKPPSRRSSSNQIDSNMETTQSSRARIADHHTLLKQLCPLTFSLPVSSCPLIENHKRGDFDTSILTHLDDMTTKAIFSLQSNMSMMSFTDSSSSSKMLLPILQPIFRVLLSSLNYVDGRKVRYNTPKGIPLISIVIDELNASVTAALVGLIFSNARDLSLSTLSRLRKYISFAEAKGDLFSRDALCSLFLTTVNEIRSRYVGERSRREQASKFAYDDDIISGQDATNGTFESVNSNEVEKLLLGGSIAISASDTHRNSTTTESDNDDFLIFPREGLEDIESKKIIDIKRSNMGWKNYKGFGVALEYCCGPPSSDTQLRCTLSTLSKYIDAWENNQALDEEESELVDLFDTLDETNTSEPEIMHFGRAADSVSTFIEISSSQNSRKNEIQNALLPSRRLNCTSFVETSCWSHFMEIKYFSLANASEFFERCLSDGSRDCNGLLNTVIVHPQFPRSIPRHFDHSVSSDDLRHDGSGDAERLKSSGIDVDLDQLNDLLHKSSLKIVDITKKSDVDIEFPEDADDLFVKSSDSQKEELQVDHSIRESEGEFVFQDHEPDVIFSQDSLNSSREEEKPFISTFSVEKSYNLIRERDEIIYNTCISSFSNPPNMTSTTLRGHITSSSYSSSFEGDSDVIFHNCLHIKTEGSRKANLRIKDTFMYLDYYDSSGLYDGEILAIEELKKKIVNDNDCQDNESYNYEQMIQHFLKTASMRPKRVRLNISELSHIFLRRYRLRDSAIEFFFIPSGGSCHGGPGLSSAMSSVLIDFGPGHTGNENRNKAAYEIMSRTPASTVKQWPDKSAAFLHEHLRDITVGWVKGSVSNFDYILALNCLSGRSFNDLCQYPVFPWVLSNYESEDIPDLNDRINFRDLRKPIGALNPDRLQDLLDRFHTFDDPVIPPFMYGSHYSTSAGVVLHFLVRLHPFGSLHRQLQGGHFDVADRIFSSVSRTWSMCTGRSAAEVKELTPEWYCNPAFLRNSNNFKFGTSQDGELIGDVQLPPWAKGSPEVMIEVMRCALESEICTSMLPDWIDLIFGRKQQGPEAVQSNNVFFYLTYYGSCDVASIVDDDLRIATELQIAHFGQCPMQLFWRPHVHKLPSNDARRQRTLSEIFGLNDLAVQKETAELKRQLPFQHAPISHWVHLDAGPPGPHAPLVALRLAFPDRCIAIDAQGIFHFFRWAWRADISATEEESKEKPSDLFTDKGYFIAQRDLPNFRKLPRLRYSSKISGSKAVAAISKCLFSGRLLIVSDGDGRGGLCYQLIDPIKANIHGEVNVANVHSAKITAIHMDPIGAAAGLGGAGGELAIVGSADGTASIWRFIVNESCCLPLRPRLRMGGHRGNKILSVAINSSLNICATVSADRCCIFHTSNGLMSRSIIPPDLNTHGLLPGIETSNIRCKTKFATTNALCITSAGYIIFVCISNVTSLVNLDVKRDIVSLELYNLEGVHLGSKIMESWRGIPNKIHATSDGRGVMVCCAKGVSIHLISAIDPLKFIDEWNFGDNRFGPDNDAYNIFVHDIDFGPSSSSPIVACAGLSSGALRLHALKGISVWSEENKKGTVNEAVSSVIGTVRGTGTKVAGIVKGTGSRIIGFGRDIGKEYFR